MSSAEIDGAELGRALLRLEADPSFQALSRSLGRTNLFQVLGTTERERWHSAFWAWLLDPEGSHGMGAYGFRQLLAHATHANGAVRAVRLVRTQVEDSEGARWKPIPHTTEPLTIADVTGLRVLASAAAPGPLSNFSEVSANTGTVRSARGGDQGRFDILLVVRATVPGSAPETFEKPRPVLLYVVVEMKVNAKYEPSQLEQYSRWVHSDPSTDHLQLKKVLPLLDAIEAMASGPDRDEGTQELETWGVGMFMAPALPEGNGVRKPESLDPPWSTVRFEDMIRAVLDPMMASQQLDPGARSILEQYAALVSHPDTGVLTMPPSEHVRLVRSLYERHRATFEAIARVFESDPDTDEDDRSIQEAFVTGTRTLERKEESIQRARSLTPKDLLDAGLARIGDKLYHDPGVNRRLGRKPFNHRLVVELVSGDRQGFELVNEPEEVKGRRLSATGLLTAVYKHYGASYSANGNAALTFLDGPSKGEILDVVYNGIRESEG